jgi:transcriptional regulator with XRE-family HTH domain
LRFRWQVTLLSDDLVADSFQGLVLRLRGRTRLTQGQLASRIGVNMRSIQAWESGISYPRAGSLQLLIAAFVDAHAFVPGQEAAEAEALWDAARRESRRAVPPFERAWFDSPLGHGAAPAAAASTSELRLAGTSSATRWHDWGDAPDVAGFVGRREELATLQRWVHHDRCRLVAVLGSGGVGKTRLAAQLTHDAEAAFERSFWRSVRNAPSATEWSGEAISALSGHGRIPPEGEAAARVSVLLELLRAHRCLIVLDNLESLLEPGRPDAQYRSDVGGYGDILRVIGQANHQSCVIVTSRESPAELAELKGNLGVRALELRGVGPAETQSLLQDQQLYGDAAGWDGLTSLYGGNCLALRVVGQRTECAVAFEQRRNRIV